MIRKCCELDNIPYDPFDWPIPKSNKCLNELQLYFNTMCESLGIEVPGNDKVEYALDEKFYPAIKVKIPAMKPMESKISQLKRYKQTTIKNGCS